MATRGLITALVTPFTSDGSKVDLKGFKRNVEYQIESGVDGVLALGTTGESPTVTDRERDAIVDAVVTAADGRVEVIVGTGTNNTKTTIEFTKRAKKAGADSALVVVPYYNAPTQEGLYHHYTAITDAVDFPICLYNHARRTGANLSLETIIRLAKNPNIWGIKECPSDMTGFDTLVQALAMEECVVFIGDDALALPAIALGASGLFSVVSNLLPSEVAGMVHSALKGDMEAARIRHRQLTPFFRLSTAETNPIPIKAMMALAGMSAGPCRLPLTPPMPSTARAIDRLIARIPAPVNV